MADDILDLLQAFDEAELNADVARLGELLAEDFASIGERGFVLGKREWIGRHGEFRYLSIETSEVDPGVRLNRPRTPAPALSPTVTRRNPKAAPRRFHIADFALTAKPMTAPFLPYISH